MRSLISNTKECLCSLVELLIARYGPSEFDMFHIDYKNVNFISVSCSTNILVCENSSMHAFTFRNLGLFSTAS